MLKRNIKNNLGHYFRVLSREILTAFDIRTFLKGSYGYGAPSKESDYDIQVDAGDYETFLKIANNYKAKLNSIMFRDSTGDKYRSTIASFKKDGMEINLVFDEHPKVWNLVQDVTKKIKSLKKQEKYVIRLVSEGLKYDRTDAVEILLRIYRNNKGRFDPELVKRLEHGEMLEKEEARKVRNIIQLCYLREVGSTYKLGELSKFKM